MSSRVIVTNSSEFRFKASTVLFSEIESPMDKFWENKMTESIIPKGETIVLGKLSCPDILPNTANFIVSIVLSLENSSEKQSQEKFLVLKSRVKNSKTGEKVYAYASSFPEKLSLTKPQWHKGNAKNYFITKFFDKILQISYRLSWNDNITFVIEQLQESPAFCQFQQSEDGYAIQDFYENQWKSNSLGHSKYSHNPISVHTDRPPFSTLNGRTVLPKSQIMPPTPLWRYIDDWHLDSVSENSNGWIYVDDWKSSSLSPENSTKFRFRRWIRTMAIKQDFAERESQNLEFISNHFRLAVDSLKDYMCPFLKELKREVVSSPDSFDFRSLAAIPSPKLRRELRILNT